MNNYKTTLDVEDVYLFKIASTEHVTYEHKLEVLIHAQSWSEIHNNYMIDYDNYIDSPMHVEKYYQELIAEVLAEYRHPKDFDIMLQWLNDNIPNWILVELGQHIKDAADENDVNREAMEVQ